MEQSAGSAEAARILQDLSSFGPVLAIKLYRIRLEPSPRVPILPCLDHEAQLHEGVSPHMAAYVQESSSGDIHEVVFIPSRRRLEVDTFSTWGESTPESHARFLGSVSQRFPGYTARVIAPSLQDRNPRNRRVYSVHRTHQLHPKMPFVPRWMWLKCNLFRV